MAVSAIPGAPPSALERLIDDYLANCEARGLSQRTIRNSYSYALKDVFWCAAEELADVRELNARALDRFTSSLLQRQHPDGCRISKHTVHS